MCHLHGVEQVLHGAASPLLPIHHSVLKLSASAATSFHACKRLCSMFLQLIVNDFRYPYFADLDGQVPLNLSPSSRLSPTQLYLLLICSQSTTSPLPLLFSGVGMRCVCVFFFLIAHSHRLFRRISEKCHTHKSFSRSALLVLFICSTS